MPEMIQEVASDLNLVASGVSSALLAGPKPDRINAPGVLGQREKSRSIAVSGVSRFGTDSISGLSREGRNAVSSEFMHRMGSALAEAMGPMASVVTRDQIAALGERFECFPRSRLTELVDLVAQEILNDKMKEAFRKTMAEEIRSMAVEKEK
jgi:hypothetical protein